MGGIGSGTKSINKMRRSRICDFEHQKSNKQINILFKQFLGRVSSRNKSTTSNDAFNKKKKKNKKKMKKGQKVRKNPNQARES